MDAGRIRHGALNNVGRTAGTIGAGVLVLRFFGMKYIALLASSSLIIIASCTPAKPETPALTPQTAATLLEFNPKAKVWLEHVKKQNAGCEYKLDLPDQTNHPTTVDVDHAVSCGGRPSPRELDATVSFAFDQASGHWMISRFSS